MVHTHNNTRAKSVYFGIFRLQVMVKGTFHEPEGIVDSAHCFEVQLWRGEGDAGSRAQPRRNGETPPLKPREPKGWLLCRYMDMSFRAGNLFFVLLFCAIVVFGVAIL